MLHSPRTAKPRPCFPRFRQFTSNLFLPFSLFDQQQIQVRCYARSPLTRSEILRFHYYLLQQCTTLRKCQQIHAHFTVTGDERYDAFVASRIISAYSRFGLLFEAQHIFDAAIAECCSNLVLWNSILRGNVSHRRYENALQVFVEMQEQGIAGDGFTFPLVVRACGDMGNTNLCKHIHCRVLEMGFEDNLQVANELIGAYAKTSHMDDARKVFDKMQVRNHISWNMVVSGYASNYDCDGATRVFQRMESEGWKPNAVTWTSLLSSHARCGHHKKTMELFRLMTMTSVDMTAESLAVILSICPALRVFNMGFLIHGYVIKHGFEAYSFLKNALISLYGKIREVKKARSIFLEIEHKNTVSWNALITSYSEAGLCDEALEIFTQMEKNKSKDDDDDDDDYLLNSNVVSWSAVITALASDGRGDESLQVFRQMNLSETRANAITISTILSLCADQTTLNHGRQVHGHVIRALMENNILVQNGLVNMYMKCGCIENGDLVFENMIMKDTISWNSMITGYGRHGLGVTAIRTFNRMIQGGWKPDGVTFVALLSACSHAGLVSDGQRLFHLMAREYMVEPAMEHYACMVDLLGRAGLLQEAFKMVDEMPIKPNEYVWSALLNSCRKHRNAPIVREIEPSVLDLVSETTGSYMLLCHIYADTGQWDVSAKVRTLARRRGLKKNTGQSWIQVNNNVCVFSAGTNLQKGMENLCGIVVELTLQIESTGQFLDHDAVFLSNSCPL